MITIVDEENGFVTVKGEEAEQRFPINSPEAFEAASRAWLRVGWDTKYVYSFSWLGRPIIQLPDDLIRIQEVIYQLKPDLVIETGVAHGGSLIFYASVLRLLGKGHVIGVDIEIRKHNRDAIEKHELSSSISLIECDSIDASVHSKIMPHAEASKCTLVLLDSNHTYDHVRAELEFYSRYVSIGSYIVVTDGIMENLVGAPRSNPDWAENNPRRAAMDFAESRPDFQMSEPPWSFNESALGPSNRVTYWPDAYLKRIS